ncbi:hypothetical protein ACFOZ5_05835 [Marinobacter lacisalsi]|uniref:Uncharacterized protein n=1 Tax=Marinobacter lacisalsi TaxID=475979 RepID=A0ABV8QDX6_9GAMM
MIFYSLSVLVAVISGLFLAYDKLSRPFFILMLVGILLCLVLAFKSYERSFMLSFVPDALGVSSVSYSQEESWGFGPGGNEAGIRVYVLPDHISEDIARHGIDFFDNMRPNERQTNRGWRGRYRQWQTTPLAESALWKKNRETGRFVIYDYVCRYGFCIDIDQDVIDQATEIVNSKGSYYAYGRIGMIVVSPENNMVLYLYNG